MSYRMSPLAEDIAKQIRHDEAMKGCLYQRVFPLIGAFDHSEMDSLEMAKYVLERLNPRVKERTLVDPVGALDAYLVGLEHRARGAGGVLDSPSSDFVDRYLAGDKE